MVKRKAGTLVVVRNLFFNQQVRQIAELAAKHRLLSIYAVRKQAEAGGLLSCGTSAAEQYRGAATYVNKLLKGAKPADLPGQQPTIFDLFINGKTAKALGLKIPQSLLIVADKIIEQVNERQLSGTRYDRLGLAIA